MNILAFDTSTERLSIALQRGDGRWAHEGAGARAASAALIPAVLDLLAQAGIALRELDAIAFGRGPGSFTGLRTACSVAQGLAFGAGVPVLPVDTLCIVAETARARHGCSRVLALLDARMDQVYSAACAWRADIGWQVCGTIAVDAPEALSWPSEWAGGDWALAGNVFAEYGARLPAALQDCPHHETWPEAGALLRLAECDLAAGRAVAAEQALPLYVRDKVARTIAERGG